MGLARLVRVKEEKVAVQAQLEDAKEDIDEEKTLTQQQALFTDFMQSKGDRLKEMALARGCCGAPMHAIMEVVNSQYTSG